MTVTFNLALDDLVQFNRFHWQHSPWARRTRARSRVIFACLGGLAGVVGASLARMTLPLVLVGVFGVCAAVFWVMELAWNRFCVHTWQPWAIRRVLSEGRNQTVLGSHELEISQAGVVDRTPHGHATQSWSSIERLADDDQYIYIYTQAASAHVIPKSAFPDTAARDLFLSEARALHRLAQRGA